jgi:serine protease
MRGSLGALLAGDERLLLSSPEATARVAAAESLNLVLRADCAVRVVSSEGELVGALDEQGGELRWSAAALDAWSVIGGTRGQVRLTASAGVGRPARARTAASNERLAHQVASGARLVSEARLEQLAGRLLVRMKDGSSGQALADQRGARLLRSVPDTCDIVEFELPQGLDPRAAERMTLAMQAAFECDPRVDYAELDYIVRTTGAAVPLPIVPNDPFYSFQAWHYDLIRAPQAWDVTTGSAAVRVAVIDTGRRPHPDLDPNTDLTSEFDFISDAASARDGNGRDANAFDEGDGTALSGSSFHGTHVAGTIGARGQDGFQTAGLNWTVDLFHLRALGAGGGTTTDILESVRYAAGLSVSGVPTLVQRADIINMSLGGPGFSQSFQNAITAARNAGCVIIAAAGNDNTSQAFFPANYTGVLSVSAVDRNADKAPYSNFGTGVDIAAPGGDISVDLNGDGVVDGVVSTLTTEGPGGGTPVAKAYQGTSMAAPHVAGVAALVLAVNPALTVAEVESILLDTTIDLGTPGRDDIFGRGLLQADAAIAAAGGAKEVAPDLVVGTGGLSFGTELTQIDVPLSNGGGGTLTVNSATISNSQPQLFASVAFLPGPIGTTTCRVSVNRTGLPVGNYSAQLTLSSNGGVEVVPIFMTVAPPPVNVDLYLLVVAEEDLYSGVDPITPVAARVLNPAVGLQWLVDTDSDGFGLAAGSYVVFCASDDDNDGFVFGSGDIYGGGYPSLNELQAISLGAGEAISGVDFPVVPLDAQPASTQRVRLLLP